MEDRLDPLVGEQGGGRGSIGVGRLDELDPVGGRPVAGREVVEDDDPMAGRDEPLDADRPDVARAAADEDPHLTSRIVARVIVADRRTGRRWQPAGANRDRDSASGRRP